MKKLLTLTLALLLSACVTTKPVATKTEFHSEWQPELIIAMPAGYDQYGPFILDGEERQKGFIREEYYPYLKMDEDGSVSHMTSITLFSLGHRKEWTLTSAGTLEITTVAGGTAIIQEQEYITAIQLKNSLNQNLMTRLKKAGVVFSHHYISKSYITSKSWVQPRTIVEYVERIDSDTLKQIEDWKKARLEQRIPMKHDFVRIPNSEEYPPSEEIKNYLEQFEQRADSAAKAHNSKRVSSMYFHKSQDPLIKQ